MHGHDQKAPTIIAGIITAVWFGSMVLDATWAAYDPPGSIHALMMAVAGWAFGERYLRRKNGGDDR